MYPTHGPVSRVNTHIHTHTDVIQVYCSPFSLSDEREEDKTDMLRAILAQMEHKYQVQMWDLKGVPFSVHMYVPEIHPITGEEFHEREDMAHVLKVRVQKCMAKCFEHEIFFYSRI